jgi:hypothetical protein
MKSTQGLYRHITTQQYANSDIPKETWTHNSSIRAKIYQPIGSAKMSPLIWKQNEENIGLSTEADTTGTKQEIRRICTRN